MVALFHLGELLVGGRHAAEDLTQDVLARAYLMVGLTGPSIRRSAWWRRR